MSITSRFVISLPYYLFQFKVTGLPTPVLQWLINGRAVIQDHEHKLLVRENNVHSLLIQPVSAMDEGQYSVVATNKAGEATVHVQLRVKRKMFLNTNEQSYLDLPCSYRSISRFVML